MISPAKVARRAHHLGVGDRVIEKEYVPSWLLVAIAESTLQSGLVFKGGTALKRCYYLEYRFSEDLDFTLCADLSHDDLVEAFKALFPRLGRRVNLTLTPPRPPPTSPACASCTSRWTTPMPLL